MDYSNDSSRLKVLLSIIAVFITATDPVAELIGNYYSSWIMNSGKLDRRLNSNK